MSRYRLLSTVVFVLCSSPHRALGAQAPDPINLPLAKAYARIARVELSDDAPDPDAAIKSLDALRAKDGRNATFHYLRAAAYVRLGDWEKAITELKAGNSAPYSIQYQRTNGPGRYTPAFVTYRQMARACAAAAPDLEGDQGVTLLRLIRAMSRQVASTEPRQALNLFAALATRALMDRTLVDLAEQKALDTAEFRKLQAQDQAFRDRVNADVRAVIGKDPETFIRAMASKYGVTQAQAEGYMDGKPTPPAVRKKLDAMRQEMDRKERPLVARWIKSMPD